jgi:poly(beta-D-mannuronate) lyase
MHQFDWRIVLVIGGMFGHVCAAEEAASRVVAVADVEALQSAAQSLAPSTILEIAPGTYELSHQLIVKARGTEDRPVTIRAAKAGDVRFRGDGGIDIEHSSHLTVDGFRLETSRGLRCQHSEYVRITNCRFQLEPTGERQVWLGFDDSRHGRVDHCEFGARDDPGSYIHISRGNRHFRIDHNYFHDYRELGHNGGESIYLHGTGVWAIHGVVEHNLFERCNGEGELIGIKSHRNIIRGNTFKDCRGAVSIRDGSYNSVYNNVFIALDEAQAAGVRIHGKHNAFVNNYLYGIYKPIECCWGDTDAPHRENLTGPGSMTKLAFAYRAAHDNLVAHNTFVACDTVFQWTKKNIPMKHIREKMGLVDRHGPFLAKLWEEETSRYRDGNFVEPMYPPRHWFVVNNVILDTPRLVRVKLASGTRPPVREEEFRWQGNIGFSRDGEFDVGPARQFNEEQFRLADPGLSEEGSGVFRPRATSICRGQAKVDRDAIKPYVDRPEIAAVLEKLSDLGASGWKILAVADVGPAMMQQKRAQ